MAEKRVIIHPGNLINQLDKKNNTPERIAELSEARELIEQVLNSAQRLVVTDDIPVKPGRLTLGQKFLDGDVYLVKEDDPVFLRDCVEQGDTVEVFGAFRGHCVSVAVDHMESTGAKVKISPKGTVF